MIRHVYFYGIEVSVGLGERTPSKERFGGEIFTSPSCQELRKNLESAAPLARGANFWI